ncbi:hypothetical protein [Deinococcus multiflagellatus]|uniref:hypothetical protein n=1 Tax=Deinococcus multiflagellatus TaxID=1656887 RepID=UPI001CC95827|nr:hypothetical protein [Deinococcus multiflagellatus]MBZ9715655.1 hypothetical protein [Deinococcus multiflagellatus]
MIPDIEAFQSAPEWGVFKLKYIYPQHYLVLERQRQLAYANFETGEWDVLEESQVTVTRERVFGMPRPSTDPFAEPRQQAWEAFVPSRHHAELITPDIVHLRDLVALAERGDAIHHLPILYIEPAAPGELTARGDIQFLETPTGRLDLRRIRADPEKRIPFFKDFQLEEGDTPDA